MPFRLSLLVGYFQRYALESINRERMSSVLFNVAARYLEQLCAEQNDDDDDGSDSEDFHAFVSLR